ncbi:PREDICTED: uncharacterized protein LOC108778731 [Cyphomyrmex costatus]|uniref:uncharacterized protein LOC108778731 n=1 Tax=Cyphomyrmex costatus TaxID=456900 RepID=UPI0008523314|nr:PREDICTED: uncharacterized protein LOC108778731 [Cyphomyrmex costatus]
MIRKTTVNRTVFLMLPWCGISSDGIIKLTARLFWIFTLGFIGYCHCLYFATHLNGQNFINLVDCLCSFIAFAKVIVKLVAFWLNQQKFVETMTLITDDWNNCAENDIGLRVMTDKAKISDGITNMIFILYTLDIAAYSFGTVIADIDITHKVELPHINKLELPFSVNTQRMYRLVLITEFIHLIFATWIHCVINIIFLAMIIHVGGQMEVLQHWLEEFIPKKNEIKQKSVVITASKIIFKHQKIIQFSQNVESIYTYIALFIFASNTILMCCLGFLVVTAIGTADFVEQLTKCILFFTSTNLEAFIFCYGGEYLNSKSNEIGFATYNCAWYNLKSKHSRILILVLLRSQKRLTLTAGKIMDLTLETFTSVRFKKNNFFNLVDCLCSFLAHAKVIANLVVFWLNQQKFVETLTLITDDWNDCAKNDNGMRVMTDKAKISDRITNTIFILHTATIAAYGLGTVITDVDITDKIELPLINKLELPFNVNTQRTYRLVLIIEFMHMILTNWASGVIYAIFLAMAIGTADFVEQMTKCVLFFTSTNLEAFIFCYAGEYLNSKSKEIGFALYNCAWYNLKSKDSRILLLVLLRSQKHLTLTAGKIMDLTLESFTSVRFKQNIKF